MKKTILHCFIYTACFAAFASCSKEVKTPSVQTKSNAVTKTSPNTNTNTNTQNQNEHHCGNHSGTSNDGHHAGG